MLGESYRISARSASGFKLAFSKLPDWRTTGIATTDGRRVELDVERLSIEQRPGLLSAIVRDRGLVEEEETSPRRADG